MSGKPNELTAGEALDLLRGRSLSAESLTQSCLERIDARESRVNAWAHLAREDALRTARALDRRGLHGPLAGIPVGIKDVFDTADMPTQMGSPIHAGHRPATDASVVALLREAGAVILGKTVTAEFAGLAPGPTANPHRLAHTPGGSSSGSAAAVADRMVPVALGTQTGGSVQRPASYCGVFGFKPTYGRVNRAGLKFAAESLDTVGWMARSLDDIVRVDHVLGGGPPAVSPLAAPRLAVCRSPELGAARPETREALDGAVRNLRDQGVVVDEVELPLAYADLARAREIINDYERARALAAEWAASPASFSAQLAAIVERGRRYTGSEHLQALQFVGQARPGFDDFIGRWDALLVPCVDGEAPPGLSHTGPSALQSLWTLLHAPTVSMPSYRGPAGLPVSIQLVGPRYADANLLQAALHVGAALGAVAAPMPAESPEGTHP